MSPGLARMPFTLSFIISWLVVERRNRPPILMKATELPIDSLVVGWSSIFIAFSFFFFFPLSWVGQDPLASGCGSYVCATAASSFSWSHKEYHRMAVISHETQYVFTFFFF